MYWVCIGYVLGMYWHVLYRIGWYWFGLCRLCLYIWLKLITWLIEHCQWTLTVSAVIPATTCFISHKSLCQYRMIWRPDHGPRVDVEEFAPWSWTIGSVGSAFWEALKLVACHRKRNGSSVTYMVLHGMYWRVLACVYGMYWCVLHVLVCIGLYWFAPDSGNSGIPKFLN